MDKNETIDRYAKKFKPAVSRELLELRYIQAELIVQRMESLDGIRPDDVLVGFITDLAMLGVIRLCDDSPTLRDVCRLLRGKHDANPAGGDMSLNEFTHTFHVQEWDGWKYKLVCRIEKRGERHDA